MDFDYVKATLIAKIKEIQADSGYPDADVDGGTCPLDLDGFDSKIWPVATGIIAETLHIDIPTDKNIFISNDGKRRRLTISEIATVICKLPVGAAAQ